VIVAPFSALVEFILGNLADGTEVPKSKFGIEWTSYTTTTTASFKTFNVPLTAEQVPLITAVSKETLGMVCYGFATEWCSRDVH
jgi:phage baseplate assembly protein gpV